MDRINELLALGMENLSAEQIDELRTLLAEEWATAEGSERTPEVVEQMAALLTSIEAVAAEDTRRGEAQAELDRQAQEMAERVAAILNPQATDVPPEDPEIPEEPPVEPEDPEAAAEVVAEAEAIVEGAPEPVAAAAQPLRIPSVPRRMRPRPSPEGTPDVIITAAGDVPGFSSGNPMTVDELGVAFFEKARAMKGSRIPPQRVARLKANRSGPKVEPGMDGVTVRRLVTAAMDEHRESLRDGIAAVRAGTTSFQAITASGGICAPPLPVYTFQTIASTARPVAAALTNVNASRGAVTWMPPIQISETNDGISVWTEENDQTPSSPATKPCVRIDCDATTTVDVDAITLCVEIGNFERIFFSERWNHIWASAQAQHARVAERNLLTYMRTNSTAVTDAQNLGASRDLFESWIRLAAAERNRQRMDPTDPVVVVTSAWVRDLIRADLTRQLPGDDAFAVADAEIDAMFARAHIMPVFTYEWPTAGPNDFAAQIAGGSSNRWPATVESLLFHSDAHFMLDGGELNLGTEIRDTTTNSTNDVNAWLETFEASGFNGLFSYRLTNSICPTGETAATVDVACTGS